MDQRDDGASTTDEGGEALNRSGVYRRGDCLPSGPGLDPERVARMRAMIAGGELEIDRRAIAEALLDSRYL